MYFLTACGEQERGVCVFGSAVGLALVLVLRGASSSRSSSLEGFDYSLSCVTWGSFMSPDFSNSHWHFSPNVGLYILQATSWWTHGLDGESLYFISELLVPWLHLDHLTFRDLRFCRDPQVLCPCRALCSGPAHIHCGACAYIQTGTINLSSQVAHTVAMWHPPFSFSLFGYAHWGMSVTALITIMGCHTEWEGWASPWQPRLLREGVMEGVHGGMGKRL